MTHKNFSLLLLGVAGFFAAASVLFWHLAVRDTFYGYDSHGDLARIGSIEFAKPLTHNITYQKRHTELSEYILAESEEKFSVLTVGDSHSDGIGGAYYQDYLADRYDIAVINSAGTKKFNSGYQLFLLMKLGYVEKLGVKTIIFEVGERGVGQITGLPNFPEVSRKEYEKDRVSFVEPMGRDMVPPYVLLSTTMGSANVKFIKNRLRAAQDPFSAGEMVGKELLTISAFTNPGQENILYYYKDDLGYLSAKPNVAAINEAMNTLADKLADMDIKLIFLVIPDKYDVYFPYIAREQDLKENDFFAEFAPLPRRYVFIDTKSIVREAVARGEKDLYWADDTHTSFKVQQLIGDAVAEELLKNDF